MELTGVSACFFKLNYYFFIYNETGLSSNNFYTDMGCPLPMSVYPLNMDTKIYIPEY